MRESSSTSRAGQLRPAVFLDRDGTIIEDRGTLAEASDVVFFPDTVDALGRLQKRLLLFLVTNQPGVARGAITLEHVNRVNTKVLSYLAEHGVTITAVYVCPHERADGCLCVKPNPYFLHRAAQEYGVDLQRSFTIGDHPHDVEFARAVRAGHIRSDGARQQTSRGRAPMRDRRVRNRRSDRLDLGRRQRSGCSIGPICHAWECRYSEVRWALMIDPLSWL